MLVIESQNVEKNENRGANRNGRRFDEEFKRDAVAMLKSGERSAQQLSQELGVSVAKSGMETGVIGVCVNALHPQR